MSAFEKMMSTFDAYKHTVLTAATADADGAKPLLEETEVKPGDGSDERDREVTLMYGGYFEGARETQNKRWQDFVCGINTNTTTTITTKSNTVVEVEQNDNVVCYKGRKNFV